jgi:hypothetical protein
MDVRVVKSKEEKTKRRSSTNGRIGKFVERVSGASREEEVIDAYMSLLGAKKWERPFGCDGLCDGTLFEFKLDVRLVEGDWRRVLAQLCYYVRQLRQVGVYKGTMYPVPSRVAGCDRNEAFILDIGHLRPYVIDERYDWRRAASSPDPALVEALREKRPMVYDMTQTEDVEVFLGELATSVGQIKRPVTLRNFAALFELWRKKFGGGLDPQQVVWAFLNSLKRREFINETTGEILFGDTQRAPLSIQVPLAEYGRFWESITRPPDNKTMRAIQARKDQLVAMQQRRETGEFFTPLDIAELAREYILKAVPDAYENWNWWDPCCGTGNLQLELPSMPGRLFMSTLNSEDVDAVRSSGQNSEACLFQYDFLNQTDEELPEELKAKLTPGSKWIFFMNPPFAASVGGTLLKGGEVTRGKVAVNQVNQRMRSQRMGSASKNLCSQFLWRIRELVEKYRVDVAIGTFSNAMWLTGKGFRKFRREWLVLWSFSAGFCFSAKEFEGSSTSWPVLFSVWRTRHDS